MINIEELKDESLRKGIPIYNLLENKLIDAYIEIERLNNIINELEAEWSKGGVATYRYLLNHLKELRGDSNE